MEHQTGLESYYIVKGDKRLRYGYTTGSCAAAAAKAATTMLLGDEKVVAVKLQTPKGILLQLRIEDVKQRPEMVSCAIRKDGGDDPDATHQALIYAKVCKSAAPGVHIDGGSGVGRVTKPGLQQAVGCAAINDVPRRMIAQAVTQVCQEQQYQGGIDVEISVKDGEKIAQKTFNPRLGIEGGISILGTTGIVVPMSEQALIDSIRVEMRMRVENNAKYLLITPGNYGELFTQEQLRIDPECSMKCSNYVGETLEMAAMLGVKGILFVAHIGKFIKVSGGIMNTHSHHADSRAELMAAHAIRAGADLTVAKEILNTVTTEESINILRDHQLLAQTMKEVMTRVQYYLNHNADGAFEVGTILFSSVHGKLAQSDNVPQLIEKINNQKS